MEEHDMILNDITRKQLIWYGHVERMDSTFTGNLKEGKNEAVPGAPGKMEYIQP
jgi:hypothetical protein